MLRRGRGCRGLEGAGNSDYLECECWRCWLISVCSGGVGVGVLDFEAIRPGLRGDADHEEIGLPVLQDIRLPGPADVGGGPFRFPAAGARA